MGIFSKTKVIIRFLLFFGLIFSSFANAKVFFGPVPEGEKSLDDHIINFLSRAKKTIDGCFFEIRDPRLVEAFLSAHKRGIEIRLLIDSNYFYLRDKETLEIDYSKRNPNIIPLLEAGINIREDNKRTALMHNKFCIVDGYWVWTGSYNLTERGSQKNENNAAEFRSKKLAKIFKREFDEMYVDERFGITSPSTVDKQSITLGKKKIEVYFAPEDNALGHIYEHLSDAKQAIYFMQFAMTANEIGDLMVKKYGTGLKVKGIFDRLLYRSTGPYAEFAKLTQNGIPVIVYDNDLGGKLHHKVFIIDPGGENPKVVFGSLNASANGNGTNDENVMVVQDRDFTAQYYEKFKELFGKTSRVVASFKRMKPIKADSIIDRLTLMVSSNGVTVTNLNIQFPARWAKEQPNLKVKIYRLRGGKAIDTTKKEKFWITPRNLYINSANLKQTGEKALLMVRMMNVTAPTIPGLYNLYIQAKSKNQPYHPLRTQPVLQVIGADQEDENDQESYRILADLFKDRFTRLNRALSGCLESYACDSFLTPGFMTKARQILRQKILVDDSTKARRALEDLDYLHRYVLPEIIPDSQLEVEFENTVSETEGS
ncbi:DUF1669 domain-containing protein [bacterium]|jgi:phosphatidylserine/phosphatidylglycerophosphate/cardiolipin synthase-like enzyme|nr:DUF1669 domain-containing protein [bacterium]